MINVLGLDPSLTHTAGFHALGHPTALELRSFAITSKPKDYAHPIARLRALRDALAAELARCSTEHAPGYVFVEGYAFGAKCSREQMGEWGGLVRLLAHEAGWTLVVVPPNTLKAYVTDKGLAPKEQMILGCFKRWGYSALNNNDCDAHCLMRLGVDYLSPREGLAKRTQELIAKLESWPAPASFALEA
jgi:Holliday junction resolvasome RuvABC endonuclease subunit